MIVKLLLLLLTALTVEGTTITATAQQGTYSPGDSVQIDVSVLNVADLYAFQFDLSFDPAVLSAHSVTEAGYFLSNGVSFIPGTIDNTAGSVSFIADSLSGPGPGLTGSDMLATIAFTARNPGSTMVSPANLVLLDSALSDIAATATATTVNVSQTTTTPEPLTTGLFIIGITALWLAARPAFVTVRRHR